ncbi:DUF1214 domain-containing protein [Ancylobacter dichloromethanicus]|uniref:Membrane protein n=1 Tax=Ancylobacter dichloromethanicus TaxID=518825 RepID=A0A9W6JDC9_9HYPH|nr:DUF1214 domain-containing protein [Ancylobacter dichloromethanicus]MBS7552511.1 DUF1214 domain-containing protein [Ancylobacter dichloromethanicus]GLK74253.1 membrane protein [Ancylobacter dichloromethanicus]
MRSLLFLLTLAIGAALGLGLTWITTVNGYGPGLVRSGPWETWPRAGTETADPYARAAFARAGELPLELADGIAFVADTDSSGKPLDGRCDIRVSGGLPQARFWTLTVTDRDGRLIENAADRTGFTSTEVVWNRDSTLDVALGPRARAGNWLPTGARDRIVLTFRLYDTSVGLANRTSDAPQMPKVVTERCPWERTS